jgi:protoporphyrinogen IX oxidase
MEYVLALHIIFMVTWFAGLFYLPRLFIYSVEANAKPEPERGILLNQFQIMKKRLWYYITWPGGVLTLIFGFWLLFANPAILGYPAFILKMVFVAALILYHLQCEVIYKQQSKRVFRFSSMKLRFFNEIPTVILFAVVFLIILVNKKTDIFYIILGCIILIGLILGGIFLYRAQRMRKEGAEEKEDTSDREPPPLAP